MNHRNLTLMTDLYELTMMQGYFYAGKQEIAVFDVYYRTNPFNGSYAICAGLEQIIQYVKNLHFSSTDIAYLRSLHIFDEAFLSYLRNFRFSGDIYAIPEGTVIFPHEPLIKVVAPIIEAQFLETAILNILNHQSLIATKAARICHAAGNDSVLEFGLRRAQGADAGIYGARAAVIGGCDGTSNVLAGKLFHIPVLGTHAHSWIMSFPDEYSAFLAYAGLYPNACILLVDTYNTLKSGVPNAIRVFTELRQSGIPLTTYGIRIDSGDLAYLSIRARKMLDEAGFPNAIITASNDLDEHLIENLKLQKAAINSWGVGTNLITASDHPSFGGVYKLVALKNDRQEFIPKMKFSENTQKVTTPGNKTIYRIYNKSNGKIYADLICLAAEVLDANTNLTLFDPEAPWKNTTLKGGSYNLRKLLQPVFLNGICVYHSPDVMEIQKICKKEKQTLWDESHRLLHPARVHVDLSEKLYHLKHSLLHKDS